VFFNRIGKPTPSADNKNNLAPCDGSVREGSVREGSVREGSVPKKDATEGRLKRRAVSLALAVQVAMPMGVFARPHVARAAGESTGTDQSAAARNFYDKARAALKAGNFTEARRAAKAARDAGFKPAMFEPSAAKLLSQIADAERADDNDRSSGPKAVAPNAPIQHDGPVARETQAPIYAVVAQSTAPTETAPTTPPADAGTPMADSKKPITIPVPAMPTLEEQQATSAELDKQAKIATIHKQAIAYQASLLVEKAMTEMKAGESDAALADANRALEVDPGNEQAIALHDKLAIPQGLGGMARTNSSINGEVERQAIRYEFDAAISTAETDINNKKFSDAQAQIEHAQVVRNQNPVLFTPSQLNEFDTRISSVQILLATDQQQQRALDELNATDKAKAAEVARNKQFQADKEREVSSLIQTARQFIEEGKYTEALGVIDNILNLDPNDNYANSVHQIIEDKANLQQQKTYRDKFRDEWTKQLIDSEEKKIPYTNIIQYSPDWPQLSKMRDDEVREEQGEGDENSALQALLDRHIPDVKYNANSLTDVIENLRDTMSANIYVDWPALERASIARDAPVTARARDIKFSKALELIFKSVNGEDPDNQLGYSIDEGVITISTKKELNKNTITRRYDINDLLFVAPDYTNAPDLSLQSATQGSQGGGAGGGGGGGGQQQSIFGGQGQQQQQQQQGADRATRIDEIKQYIIQNVDNPSWKDNGGDVGTVSSSPLRAILLITQTPENQRKIVSVLDSLRASQALQVSIEARFLTVQRNYLEDIGVNASFEFNPLQQAGNARSGFNSSRFSPIVVDQDAVTNNSTFLDANGNLVANAAQGSRQLDWISNVGNAAVPGSIAANPGDYPNPIVIQGSYLDNFTVDFLIRAVQANQNTTSLTAPRLTLFSGQRAVLVVSTQQAYVSDLIPVVATGAALFQPVPQTTYASAVVLKVQATVSPDRKYVYLDLQPQLARLRALVPFTISAVITPATGAVGVPTTNNIINGTFQLPTIDVTQVFTSVSVPDGATLLLGGQTLAAETTREQGVPVLSKIPILKRLFTNRATSQDEQILLILVKPTILIQHETEQKQFPQLSSRVGGT
jgi:type II secretory pathway component GspD/PulD (secretin)/tetratricopeptide (TPR) repeat protein